MAEVEPSSPEQIELDGMLIRPDLALLRGVTIVSLMLLAMSVASASIETTVAILSVAGLLVFQHVASGLECREPVNVTINSKGLNLRREKKETILGPWHFFESITLRPRYGFILESQRENWRLYLTNTFKPSIGAFLHHKAAARTIFYFPLEIDIEADREGATRICARIHDYISSAEDPVIARRRRILSLRKQPIPPPPLVCIHCEYTYREPADDDRCPRCGLPQEA